VHADFDAAIPAAFYAVQIANPFYRREKLGKCLRIFLQAIVSVCDSPRFDQGDNSGWSYCRKRVFKLARDYKLLKKLKTKTTLTRSVALICDESLSEPCGNTVKMCSCE
jgi:hypothetical protein